MNSGKIVRGGLIGATIQASRSPAMHEGEGRRHGLDYRYTLFDLAEMGAGLERLPALLDQAQAQGYVGLNITHPCKQAVIPLLDELSEEARDIGAVNTVVLKDGRRVGHNTDWWGFRESLTRGLPGISLRTVLQLGAGGAGSATAYALMKLGAERLIIFDKDAGRAGALAEQLNALFGPRVEMTDDPVQVAAQADGVVQTTPIGMAAHPGLPLPAAALRPEHWLAEVIYFPLETELLRAARALGCRTVDGSGMAVFQAARAIELFLGVETDADAMLRDLLAKPADAASVAD